MWSIDPGHKHGPAKIYEAAKALFGFPLKRPPIWGDNQAETSLAIINDFLDKGIEESRHALQQIVSDLEIKDPIRFQTAEILLGVKSSLREKWAFAAKNFVHLFRKYVNEMDLPPSLYLIADHDLKKIEAIMQTLEQMGLLSIDHSELKNDGLIHFVQSLCETPDPLKVLSQFKSLPLCRLSTLNSFLSSGALELLHTLRQLPLPIDQFSESTLLSVVRSLQNMSPQSQQEALSIAKLLPIHKYDSDTINSFLRSGALDLLHTLQQLPLSLDRFGGDSLLSVVNNLQKMTLQNQQETLRLMGKIIPCLDEQYISMDIRDLVEVITKNPNRMTDIETVISSRSWGKYEGPIEVNWLQVSKK